MAGGNQCSEEAGEEVWTVGCQGTGRRRSKRMQPCYQQDEGHCSRMRLATLRQPFQVPPEGSPPVVAVHSIHVVLAVAADAPHGAAQQVPGSKGGHHDAGALAAAGPRGGGSAGRRVVCRGSSARSGSAEQTAGGCPARSLLAGPTARTPHPPVSPPRASTGPGAPQGHVLLVPQRRDARKCCVHIVQIEDIKVALGLKRGSAAGGMVCECVCVWF